jgi:gamma-glutamyltranspeptidase / glutathione hydrolase
MHQEAARVFEPVHFFALKYCTSWKVVLLRLRRIFRRIHLPQELIGEHAGFASTHAEGSEAAKRIVEKGGNAIDAAVAATLTLCVVRVGGTGLGGYGGGLVYYDSAKRNAIAVNFDSRAPKGYRDELYADPAVRQRGCRAMSVPANVAGLALALKKFGTMSWRDVSGDAIRLADEGFIVPNDVHGALRNFARDADPVSRKALLPDGKVPEIGEKFVQRDLAKLLKRLADEGPGIFYEGDIPQRIVKQVQANGGILSVDDFKLDLAHQVDPLHVTYRGHDVYTPPLPSGGVTTLEILKALDRFDLSQMQAWTAEPTHLFAEVAKRCWNDRLASLADPDFVKDSGQFLSDAHADELAAQVREGKIYQTPFAPPPGAQHTASVSCIDSKHNLCSLTCTHGETMGCNVVIEGLGLILNNGMSRFIYEGNGPNRAAALKRVFHNMCPVVIARDQHPFASLGHTGGPTIVNITAEMAMALIDFRRTPGQLVSDPRLHTDGREPLQVTSDFPDELIAELEKRGHKFEKLGHIGGPMNAVMIDHSSQQVRAASAAREQGAAVW